MGTFLIFTMKNRSLISVFHGSILLRKIQGDLASKNFAGRSVIIQSAAASNRLAGNKLTNQEVADIYDWLKAKELIEAIEIKKSLSPKQRID